MEDRELLELLDKNAEEGLRLLMELYTRPVYYAAAQRLESPEDIRECVQDTFADFYLWRKRFDLTQGTLKVYLTAIAQRKAIKCYHDNVRQRLLVQRMEPPPVPSLREEEAELYAAMSCLAGIDRRILRMKYLEGYNAREIGERVGMSHEAVKKRIQRSLHRLLVWMEDT